MLENRLIKKRLSIGIFDSPFFSILFLLYFACIRKLLPHRSLGNKQESQYKLSSPYAQVYLCLDLQPEINRMKFILINSTETIFVDHYFYVGLNPQERRLQKIKLIFQNYNMSYIHKVGKWAVLTWLVNLASIFLHNWISCI